MLLILVLVISIILINRVNKKSETYKMKLEYLGVDINFIGAKFLVHSVIPANEIGPGPDKFRYKLGFVPEKLVLDEESEGRDYKNISYKNEDDKKEKRGMDISIYTNPLAYPLEEEQVKEFESFDIEGREVYLFKIDDINSKRLSAIYHDGPFRIRLTLNAKYGDKGIIEKIIKGLKLSY